MKTHHAMTSPTTPEPPTLPQSISPDGRELWEWAAQAGDFIHRQAKRNELTLKIAKVACGDCKLWMTSECPREKNVNGWNRGPSMNGTICEIFDEKPISTEMRAQWKQELADLSQP